MDVDVRKMYVLYVMRGMQAMASHGKPHSLTGGGPDGIRILGGLGSHASHIVRTRLRSLVVQARCGLLLFTH